MKVRSSELGVLKLFTCLFALTVFLLFALPAWAEDNALEFIEQKSAQLAKKEEALKKEEKRLSALRVELDDKIEHYTRTLARIEQALQKLKESREGNLKHLVKTYEAMPAENAAQRLAALPEATAMNILTGMNSRKAGAAMALMTPRKVSSLTRKIEKAVKKIPLK